jgi:hypothetical protein
MSEPKAVAATPSTIAKIPESGMADGKWRGRGLALAATCAGLILAVADRSALAGIEGAATSAPPTVTSTTGTVCRAPATPGDVADLIALHRGVGSGAISAMPHELARRPAPADDVRSCTHRAKRAEGRRG